LCLSQSPDVDDDIFCKVNYFDYCGICGGTNVETGICSNTVHTTQALCDADTAATWTPSFSGSDIDCSGVCGGPAVLDDCQVCNGDNESKDCAGVCYGAAKIDLCGICQGDNKNNSFCSNAVHTTQALCDADTAATWTPSFSGSDIDCSGVCGGPAVLDDCQACNGNNKDKDCEGICNGSAKLDDCGFCITRIYD
jgi:hypothetical protein